MTDKPNAYDRTNWLKAARFGQPDFIPVRFHINDACYDAYPQEWLFGLMEAHPFLFPGFERPPLPWRPSYAPNARVEGYTDDFGCRWSTAQNGITGLVTGHPLADLDALEIYTFPDPAVCTGIGPIDWAAQAVHAAEQKRAGRITKSGLRHGHTFLQLIDLMGYEELSYAMADEEPRLWPLLEGVEAFNLGIVQRVLETDPDIVAYPEDLGMSTGPMLSPENFRRYILPSYRRLTAPAKTAGKLIHMHSDGDIRLLAGDLLACGIGIVNLQDVTGGLEWIRENLYGKVCIELDIDRGALSAQGTSAEIDAHLRRVVETLGSKSGGLALVYGLYPGIPPENVEALMGAFERYALYYS